jgi:hypothetical protein
MEKMPGEANITARNSDTKFILAAAEGNGRLSSTVREIAAATVSSG